MNCYIDIVIICVMMYVLFCNKNILPMNTLYLGGMAILLFAMSRVSTYSKGVDGGAPFNKIQFDINTIVSVILDLFQHPEAIKDTKIIARVVTNIKNRVPYDNNNPNSAYYLGSNNDRSFITYTVSEKTTFVRSIASLIKELLGNLEKCTNIFTFFAKNGENIIEFITEASSKFGNKVALRELILTFITNIIKNCSTA